MFFSGRSPRACLLAAFMAAGCSTATKQATPLRYAVLRFENLTSDRANDWVGRAASEVLIRELGALPSASLTEASLPFAGHGALSPGVSSESSNARLAGATRLITGYFDGAAGDFHFTAVEEDAATGRTVQAKAAAGTVLAALGSLAKQFATAPRPAPTSSEQALKNYVLGIEASGTRASGTAETAGNFFAAAIAADPNFAEPYLAWSEAALAHRDRPTAQRILSEARLNKLAPGYVARLELADATLAGDSEARQQALLHMVSANPGDRQTMKALADAEFAAHHFQEAAVHYTKVAGTDSPDVLNLVAYARMFGGDEKGALSAIQEYQKLRPQDANANDSEGDISFYFGRFAAAEKAYLQAAAKDNSFNQGLETWKAARARLIAGDVSGAAELFSRYRLDREKAKDPSVPYRVAEWQYLSGDRASGMEAMHKVVDGSSNAALKAMALTQASIWELQTGRREEAIRDADAVIKAGQNASVISAAIVRFAASGPAPVEQLKARAGQFFHGEGSEQLRNVAVAYTLFFSKRYGEAAPLWKSIYEQTNPNEQAAGFLYAGALKETGTGDSPLLQTNPIPPVLLSANFESLYFPQLLNWRGDHAGYLKLMANTEGPAR